MRAIADTCSARDRHDGSRLGMLNKSPDELRSKGREERMTSHARARHHVFVSAGGYARPPPMQTSTGGAESLPVMDMLAGLSRASGAWRRRRPLYGRIGVYSSRSGRCRDGMVRQAKESVGASVFLQCYGSGGYSDRSGRCWDAIGCSGQRDGALQLSAVGRQHGRGDKIGHSDGQCENSVGARVCLLMEK